MPTYYGRAASVSLCVAELRDCITEKPWNSVCQEATKHIKKNEVTFDTAARNSRLFEMPIRSEEDDSSRVQFLGPDKDMPFFFVRATNEPPNQASSSRVSRHSTQNLPNAGHQSAVSALPPSQDESGVGSKDLSDVDTTKLKSFKISTKGPIDTETTKTFSTRSTRKSLPEALVYELDSLVPKPQAFCIAVNIDGDCFLNPPSNVKQIDGNKRKLDLKIDAFINGEFEGTDYISSRYQRVSQSYSITKLFHGRRVDRLREMPWILVPSGQNADGTLRGLKRSQAGEAQNRWRSINDKLRRHALSLGKTDENETYLLSQYLEDLTRIPAPQDLQKPGGLKFGVIDVIISLGRGKKDEPSKKYLLEPTPDRLSTIHIEYAPGKGAMDKKRMPMEVCKPMPEFQANSSYNLVVESSSPLSPLKSHMFGTSTSEAPSDGMTKSYGALSSSIYTSNKAHMINPSASTSPSPIGPRPKQRGSSTATTRKNAGRPPLSFEKRTLSKKESLCNNLESDTKATTNSTLSPQLKSPQRIKFKVSSSTMGLKKTKAAQWKENEVMCTQPKVRKTRGSAVVKDGLKSVTPVLKTRELNKTQAREGGRFVIDTSLLSREPSATSKDVLRRSSVKRSATAPSEDEEVPSKKLKLCIRSPNSVNLSCSNENEAISSMNRLELVDRNASQADQGSSPRGEMVESEKENAPIKPKTKIVLGPPRPPVWAPDHLSNDCIVTYATDMIRQIPSERRGNFSEAGILMGVRYILS